MKQTTISGAYPQLKKRTQSPFQGTDNKKGQLSPIKVEEVFEPEVASVSKRFLRSKSRAGSKAPHIPKGEEIPNKEGTFLEAGTTALSTQPTQASTLVVSKKRFDLS